VLAFSILIAALCLSSPVHSVVRRRKKYEASGAAMARMRTD